MELDCTVVNKTEQVELFDIIKFQLITHCFVKKITLGATELNLLALLGVCGDVRLVDFCKFAVESNLFGTPNAVNNCLTALRRGAFFEKGRKDGKKVLFLSPTLGIQTKGNIVLNYRIVRIETSTPKDNHKANSREHELVGAGSV